MRGCKIILLNVVFFLEMQSLTTVLVGGYYGRAQAPTDDLSAPMYLSPPGHRHVRNECCILAALLL
jgi:hypothetical protein